MTLRSKLLISIVVVNVVVIGGLTYVITLQNERIDQGYRRGLQATRKAGEEHVLQVLESAMESWARNLRDPDPPLSLVLDDTILRLFEDAIIVNRWEVIEGVTLDPNIFLNGKGRRVRQEELNRDEVLRRIRLAIDANEIRTFPGGWLAVPIMYRDGDSRVEWGGLYGRLPDPQGEEPQAIGALPSAGIMLAGLLLVVAISYTLLSRVLVKPLDNIVAGSRRVAGGDYDQPVPDPGGNDEIAALVRAFNAMAERVGDYHHHLEERVREATAKAEAARRHLVIAQRLAATGTLASGIAHEINNPLGGLINATRSLQRRRDIDDSGQRYLALIHDGLLRISETVRKVLSFSPRQVEPRAVSLKDVILRARDLASHQMMKRGVEFDLSGADATVIGAPGELQQVFLNLFLNAADAIESGGRIAVRLRPDGGRVVTEVEDNGCGMSPEQVEQAFDLFFSTKEVGEGTGLGLSIAHHIITNHGGTIEIASERGKGTTIRITLPLHRNEPPPESRPPRA
ncbi:MAG: HAMP domain-containing sensor histidine kinase [Planctomycetota bacterium]